MLSSLYRKEIFARTQGSLALNESNMSKGFSVFHDYLGLANLIVASRDMKPAPQPYADSNANSFFASCPPINQHQQLSSQQLYQQQKSNVEELPSPTSSNSESSLSGSDLMDFQSFFEPKASRKRINSLESDARNDSSISSRSGNSNCMYLDLNMNSSTAINQNSMVSTPSSSSSSPVLASVPFMPPPPPTSASMISMGDMTSIEPILANRSVSNIRPSASQKQNAKNNNASKVSVCVFCRNNGESREFYSSHTLKDSEGATTCPILRKYTCPLCKANGDQSHTIKYCPKYTPKAATPIQIRIGQSKITIPSNRYASTTLSWDITAT